MTSPSEDPRRRLADAASTFADTLTRLLNETVTVGASVTSAARKPEGQQRRVAIVAPGAAEAAPGPPKKLIPLSIDPDEAVRDEAALWIDLEFRMVLDPERAYAAVWNSSLGLVVDPDPASQRPLLRMEYDRAKTEVPPAHVHIHGTSEELAYACGKLGQRPRPLRDLHVPVGSRRYRPTVEDFIEFLAAHNLATDLHQGWRNTIAETRQEWEHTQLKAAIRRNVDVAVQALEDNHGYTVQPPDN